MARGLGKNRRGFANSAVTRSQTIPITVVELSDPVSLYLPFDSDVNDDSDNNHTVTAYNSAAISSTQSKFGGNSLYLDGTDQYLSLAGSTDFDFGTGDFTIEAWIYPTASQGSHIISAGAAGYWSISWNYTSRYFQFYRSGGTEFVGLQTPNFSLNLNQWQHVAVCRMGALDGSTLKSRIKMFINGNEQTLSGNPSTVPVGVINASNSFDSDSNSIEIGRNYGSTNSTVHWKGYIDDVRIIKGLARYTKDFIPPSQAVGSKLSGSNETNTTTDFTALYLPFDSDVNDDSTNAFTGTAAGGASITTSVKKFGAGSLSLNSGNRYVDYGNNSAFDLGSGDFTFEAWVYQNDTGSNPIFGKDAVNGERSYYLQLDGGKITFFFTTDGSTVELYDWHNGNVTSNNWHHVAVVRSGTQLYCFLDGVSDPSPTITGGGIGTKTINTNSANFRVGNRQLFNVFFNGYIDDFRYVKGTAVYTSNFTPPTSAVGTSVGKTVNDLAVLYLPFDSETQFADQARNHGIHTTGSDPVISTSVKKFGTGSLHLDGDDYLWYNHDESLNFGTNDFTVEAWFYVADDSSVGRWLGKSDVTSGEPYGWFIVSRTDNKWGFNAGSGTSSQSWDIASNADLGTLTLNTWTHLAVTREGNTFRLFNNGSLITTFTSSLSMTTGDQPLGVGRQGGNSGTANGYLDDVRIINGHALYTAAFTPPTAAVGSAVQSGGVTTSTVDNKFLSSVWSLKDQNKKISKGEWIRNDSADTGSNGKGRSIKGAGLEVEGHRHYTPPPAVSGVEILAVGAGGHGGNRNTSGGNTVFTHSGTGEYILAVGGGGAAPADGGVGRSGGGGGGFVSATYLTLNKDVGYTLTIGASGATPQAPREGGLPSWPGGSGGGGTLSGGNRGGGTGVQPSTPQPLISGIPGASNIQNLGYDGTGHPPGGDNPGSANGPGRGGGGLGTSSSITGSSQTYAGGGYSGNRYSPSPYLSNPGPGGSGSFSSNPGGDGIRGGGGGGAGASSNLGGLGGAGVFVVAYPDAESDLTITGTLSYTQPTRSGYKVYEFTSGSGTISLDS